MSPVRTLPLARSLLTAAALAFTFTAPAAAAPPGPPITVTTAELDAAFECSGPLTGLTRDPVLLTPAFSTAEESYAWNYRRQLPKAGITTCSLTMPEHGFGDMQRTAEYVVAAVRRMSAQRGGGQVALMGHALGGLSNLWALRFWPDLPGLVSDDIALAAPFQGTSTATGCKAESPCPQSLWQIAPRSAFVAALNRVAPPKGPGYTSIATAFDEVITPQPSASRLPGATNVSLQSICPLRPAEHFLILADNIAYLLVMDALTHPGPANPSRISRLNCLGPLYLPGTKIESIPTTLGYAASTFAGIDTYGKRTTVAAEPPLRPYAAAS
jgi:pimeloyl-ACP methyl ester carboxylesterase